MLTKLTLRIQRNLTRTELTILKSSMQKMEREKCDEILDREQELLTNRDKIDYRKLFEFYTIKV